ncbi:MAG: PH domain-containing protein [Aliifodinibius sp.]|nr:PH domain-containing protein [Fodinibius sp.]NIV09830.1 PH domain-containing protein [Fodinibius sp.]NIY23374.1 PH domain-containing protein [Fodinibius sp.]
MRSSPKRKLSHDAIKAWRVSLSILILFLVLGLFFVWGYKLLSPESEFFSIWTLTAISVILVVVTGLGIFFIPEIRWQRWSYEVDEHEVDLQSGIFIITRTLVPIKRVQHVDTRQGPILRSYDLADVTISTAATTHRIPALNEEVADQVRDQISKFARLAEEDV